MSGSNALARFSERLGHSFKDPAILETALTHLSKDAALGLESQRMEFLGDRILGMTVAAELFRRKPSAEVGQIATQFNALVRNETCAEIAESIGVPEVLSLGKTELKTGGRRKRGILGDVMEALIAAVYLDAGFAEAREVVLRHWGARIDSLKGSQKDPKTVLQEWANSAGHGNPVYSVVSTSGPPHAPEFRIKVALESGEHAEARAETKKNAERKAAQALLTMMSVDHAWSG